MENNSNSFEKKKKNVPEKRKLRFKDMRRGFAAHEKTHVLRGEVTIEHSKTKNKKNGGFSIGLLKQHYSILPPIGHAFSRALRNPGACP